MKVAICLVGLLSLRVWKEFNYKGPRRACVYCVEIGWLPFYCPPVDPNRLWVGQKIHGRFPSTRVDE